MNITQEEAAKAMRDIEASRATMRTMVRSHRGHLYLWLWGGIWMACSLLYAWDTQRFSPLVNWINIGGVVASFFIGYIQGRQVRSPINKRLVGVFIALLAFGYGVWPVFLGYPHSYKAAYGYGVLLWMQVYVVAGIWIGGYLLWLGIAVTAILLAGFLFFPAFFWTWSFLSGATMVGTGFYVRFCWR